LSKTIQCDQCKIDMLEHYKLVYIPADLMLNDVTVNYYCSIACLRLNEE